MTATTTASQFTVLPEELLAARATCSQAASDARAALARIRGVADDVFGRGWSGAAARASTTGFHEWSAGAALVLEALDAMSGALGRAAADYSGAESASRGTVLAAGPA